MATIKTTYIVQSCPHCHKQLLKVAAGSKLIGSPLITCKGCGRTYRTDLRSEWYNYPSKSIIWIMPVLFPAVALLVSLFLEAEAALVFLAAVIFLLIGLGFSAAQIVRMLKSKKRMRDAQYLDQLLLYGAIAPADYAVFKQQAL